MRGNSSNGIKVPTACQRDRERERERESARARARASERAALDGVLGMHERRGLRGGLRGRGQEAVAAGAGQGTGGEGRRDART